MLRIRLLAMVDRADMISTSPNYVGVVAEMVGFRFVVSARGAAYEIQESDRSGNWRVLRSFPQARFLWDWCFVNDVDLTQEFEASVEALPDNPADCQKIPYSGGRRSKDPK